jgi:hypothetical protein
LPSYDIKFNLVQANEDTSTSSSSWHAMPVKVPTDCLKKFHRKFSFLVS